MNFMKSVNSAFGIAVGTAASYGIGYLYGAIYRMNKIIAAQAFAVTIASTLTFNVLVNLGSGGADENPKTFYATRLIGGTLLATVQILALRRLNLIANLGTALLTFNAMIIALEDLNNYNKS